MKKLISLFIACAALASCSTPAKTAVALSEELLATRKQDFDRIKEVLFNAPCDGIEVDISAVKSPIPPSEPCLDSVIKCCGSEIPQMLRDLDVIWVFSLRNTYISYTLEMRNHRHNYYYLSEYSNLDDTIKYLKPGVKHYRLSGNWILGSDENL